MFFVLMKNIFQTKTVKYVILLIKGYNYLLKCIYLELIALHLYCYVYTILFVKCRILHISSYNYAYKMVHKTYCVCNK